MDDGAFTVDGHRVVHETIDDEVILIDLETGTYYSLEGSGSEIWSLLIVGVPLERVIEALNERYPAQSGTVGQGVQRLVRELVDERLLLTAAAGDVKPPACVCSAQPFVSPVLRRYTDMEYFLRLDPIHDVDEHAGWPVQPADRVID